MPDSSPTSPTRPGLCARCAASLCRPCAVLITFLGLLAFASSCARSAANADTQIRERIAFIRAAILARDAAGIVRWGTDDWTFVDGAGKSYDKAAYLVRTRALMERIVVVDSLDSRIDSIAVIGDTATVELTQTMERHERDAVAARIVHVRLRYHEKQTWTLTPAGWCVRRVAFAGPPERTELPNP